MISRFSNKWGGKKTVPYSVIISKTKAIIQNTEYSFVESMLSGVLLKIIIYIISILYIYNI